MPLQPFEPCPQPGALEPAVQQQQKHTHPQQRGHTHTITQQANTNTKALLELDAQLLVRLCSNTGNLLDDEEYGLAQNMVLNPGLRPELSEVLFSDVIARPNRVKLPVLVMLMDSPGHPLRMEAHTSLQEVLGQDLGAASTSWAQPVQDFLAREAAEAAPEETEASDAAP